MMADITLTVDEGRPASAAHFFTAGADLLDLLDDLADNAGVDWTVADLRRGSAVSELSATGSFSEAGRTAAHQAVAGLILIRDGEDVPGSWSPDAISHAKELTRHAGPVAKVESQGNVVYLDDRLRENLAAVTPWVREYYGSVRGQLTGVNVTRGNRASVRPHEGGRVIHVGFPTAVAEKMRAGLLGFVEVEGTIKQNEQGRIYYVNADDVSVIRDPTLSWRDMRGFMPEIIGDRSVTEYLEDIRGEQ